VLRVGLAYYVYVLTGSTLASATMLLASFVPQILLGSVAGVFVDRWDATRTMIAANLLLAVGLIPLFAVHTAGDVWIAYAVVACEGCVAQFFSPAEQAMLPRVVEDADLVALNACNGQSRDLSRLLGSAAGGMLAATGGIAAITAVDLASFVVSAALITRIRTVRRGERAEPTERRLAQLGTDWTDGLRVSATTRVLRIVLMFLLVTSLGEGIMGTLFAPFVRAVLHGSSSAYGDLVSVQAIGGIAGGAVAAALSRRVRPERLLGWGAVGFGAIDLAMFLYPLAYRTLWPAVVCMVAVGVPGAALLTGAVTLLQRHAPADHVGRVFGALNTVEGISVVGGSVLAGSLGDAIGIVPVIAAQGGGYVVAGLLVLAALRRPATAPRGEASPPPPLAAVGSPESGLSWDRLEVGEK
jgi:Na+/melibiose symporter-like transporter